MVTNTLIIIYHGSKYNLYIRNYLLSLDMNMLTMVV